MTDNRNARKPKKIRASVIRRTVVGSLVVMLSPFLTVLESDASASATMRKPIIFDSSPAIERSIVEIHSPLGQVPNSSSLLETGSMFAGIEASLRQEARLYWMYDNVAPEAIALQERISP